MCVFYIALHLRRLLLTLLFFTLFFTYISYANEFSNNKIENVESYSIISDLRSAFNPYSSLYIESDYETHVKSLTPFALSTLDTQFYINTFDEGIIESNVITKRAKVDSKDDKKSKLESKLEPKIDSKKRELKIIPSPINPHIDISLLAPICAKRKFNLSKVETLDSKIILTELAKECGFSIQYAADTKALSDTSIINIRQKPLDFVLNMLLKDVFYKIEANRLIIKGIDMRIFEINYVSSARMAQSNTDVLFSQEQNSTQSNPYINSYTPYFNRQNLYPQNSNINPFLMQGLADSNMSKQQLRNQINSSNSEFGKSGTKVYSLDENNFWLDIESRLNIMLDIAKGDRFMIDRGSGLISVWSNKSKMQEVAIFLQNIESKMNLQVSLDVEILSLTHFNSSNIGIDWQQAFKILNPLSSSLNISTDGGSIFTIQNSSTNLNPLFNFLKTYGNLRSLSNPKIMALNNQPAIISVGSVLRYTQELVYQSNNANSTIQNTSKHYPSVFAGILLDITPSISDDEIILRINPAITKTKDPDLENTAQALISPPNLSTNQLSSIVRLRDGERVVIGGLLNNINHSTTQGMPFISKPKILKNVFGKEARLQRSEELIIIITPRIIR